MTIALETKGLEKSFGGLKVTRDLSLQVKQGARHALIGPNGAGKTTVINLLTGVLKPNGGRILLEGNDITDLPVHTRVLRGLSRTFQINQLYADLTPLETVGLAVSERLGRGGDWWRRMGTRPDVNEEIAGTLARFHLLDVMNELTATLPYGKQRLLEIAVAIATKPRVLLLDEPAAGVPEERAPRYSGGGRGVAARRHGAIDRARHGPGVLVRRPHFRPRQRCDAGGGAARRRSLAIRRSRRSISARAPMPELLVIDALARRLWREPWCCPRCRCHSAKARCWRCWDATAPARPR